MKRVNLFYLLTFLLTNTLLSSNKTSNCNYNHNYNPAEDRLVRLKEKQYYDEQQKQAKEELQKAQLEYERWQENSLVYCQKIVPSAKQLSRLGLSELPEEYFILHVIASEVKMADDMIVVVDKANLVAANEIVSLDGKMYQGKGRFIFKRKFILGYYSELEEKKLKIFKTIFLSLGALSAAGCSFFWGIKILKEKNFGWNLPIALVSATFATICAKKAYGLWQTE